MLETQVLCNSGRIQVANSTRLGAMRSSKKASASHCDALLIAANQLNTTQSFEFCKSDTSLKNNHAPHGRRTSFCKGHDACNTVSSEGFVGVMNKLDQKFHHGLFSPQ